jgi:hypothetical protein
MLALQQAKAAKRPPILLNAVFGPSQPNKSKRMSALLPTLSREKKSKVLFFKMLRPSPIPL